MPSGCVKISLRAYRPRIPPVPVRLEPMDDPMNTTRNRPDISVIIPAFNEEGRILPTLGEVTHFLDRHFGTWQVLVINDGSRDGTGNLVTAFSREQPNVVCHDLPENAGKGAAVRFGVRLAAGRRILYMDADGAIPIEDLHKLMPVMTEGFPIVIGSKSFPKRGGGTKWYRLIMGRVFNAFVRLFLIKGVHDSQCGFKLFEHDAAKTIFELQTVNGFSFDLEVLYLANKLGIRFREVPVTWSNISGSRIHLVRDSIRMFLDIFRIRARHAAQKNEGCYGKGESLKS